MYNKKYEAKLRALKILQEMYNRKAISKKKYKKEKKLIRKFE